VANRQKPSAQLPVQELLLLSDAQSAKELASEKLAHTRTRADLMRATAELASCRAELAAREAEEISRNKIREAVADHDAAHKKLADLTLDIRSAHNLTERHVIDGATGAIIQPET